MVRKTEGLTMLEEKQIAFLADAMVKVKELSELRDPVVFLEWMKTLEGWQVDMLMLAIETGRRTLGSDAPLPPDIAEFFRRREAERQSTPTVQ